MVAGKGVTRRTFLMGALASAAAPAFFTSRAAAGGGPNDTMLLAAIGNGRMGNGDMMEMLYQGLDLNARIVAVCDVDSNRMKQAKGRVEKAYAENAAKVPAYGGCSMFSDFRELLRRKDIDGVLVATPDFWHAPIAVAAAKAGKDVYVEKPLTYSIAEGQALVRAVRKNRIILQVGSQQRSSIYFRSVCELVRNGRIGKLHTIRVTLPADKGTGDPALSPVPPNLNYDMWMGPTAEVPYGEGHVHPQKNFGRPGWLQVERYCLGMVTGWGAHMNDTALWGSDMEESGLVEIEAKGEFPKRGVFDVHTTFRAEGKLANGVKLIQETADPAGVRFEGDDGWVFVSREERKASNPEWLKEKHDSYAIKLYESKNHMANFLQCVRSRKEPVAPVEVGHRANSVCVVTHIAMKLGRKLEWDPKAEKFVDDAEANAMLDYTHRKPWEVKA